jgi:hypothetical protein
MPLASVCVSVDNDTEREGVGDKVRISYVVQPPHLVREQVGAIGAVWIAQEHHGIDDHVPQPQVRLEVVRVKIAAVAATIAVALLPRLIVVKLVLHLEEQMLCRGCAATLPAPIPRC